MRQGIVLTLPSAAVALLLTLSVETDGSRVFVLLASLGACPFICHYALRQLNATYRRWCEQIASIHVEIAALRTRMNTVMGKYRKRYKGERFKDAYELSGRRVGDLEEAMSVGMYWEEREVFVTAFVRQGVAVRVTASIGSPLRCAASDNPSLWSRHAARLGCDEIRQYHNHPDHNGITSPSETDYRTAKVLRSLLGTDNVLLRSMIIYWNALGEWKIIEYDDTGQCYVQFEFDVSG